MLAAAPRSCTHACCTAACACVMRRAGASFTWHVVGACGLRGRGEHSSGLGQAAGGASIGLAALQALLSHRAPAGRTPRTPGDDRPAHLPRLPAGPRTSATAPPALDEPSAQAPRAKAYNPRP
jgi:hypothetical protein